MEKKEEEGIEGKGRKELLREEREEEGKQEEEGKGGRDSTKYSRI